GATPGGLKDIFVDGGEPTASDKVIVNGADDDAIDFSPTAADSADITGAGPVPIHLTTVETVVINGLGRTDTLTLNGTANDDTTIVHPTIGTGSFTSNLSPALSFTG